MSSHFSIAFTLLVFALVFLPQLICAQIIITDRPDLTESAISIPKNTFQLETGIQFGHVNYNPDKSKILHLPTTLLRIGIFENLELRLANQFARVSNEAINPEIFGFGDVELGVKWELLNKANVNTRIAVLSHFLLPIGDKRLSNIEFGAINKLLIEHNLTTNLLLGYNVGYSYFGPDCEMATYSVVLANMLTKKLGIYGEVYGEWLNFSTLLANSDAGFTYLLKDNLQIDASYGIGLNYRMHYFATGISWNFGL